MNKVLTFFVALIPILGIYKLGSIPLDIIFLTAGSIILIKKKTLFDYKLFFILSSFLIIGIFSVINNYSANEEYFFNNTYFGLLYFFIFSLIIKNADSRVFEKATLILGIFASIIVIIQFISYYLFNIPLEFKLPLNLIQARDKYLSPIEWGRPDSLFLEPAHYSLFILPIMYNCLLRGKKIIIAFFFIAIVLSTSTTGFIVSLFLLFYHYIIKEKKILLTSVFFIIIYLLSIFFTDVFLRNIEKIDPTNINSNVRVLGTKNLVEYILNDQFFFGIGLNQISSTYSGFDNYANTFFMTFISYGILGIIVLAILVRYLFKINNNKMYLFIFLFIMLSDQLLFNRNFFFLISTIYLFNNHKNPIKNEKKYNIFLS